MRFRGEIWRQRLWIWVPALLFFLANVAAFAVYTVGYGRRLDALDDTLAGQEQTRKKLAAEQRDARAMLDRVKTNDQLVEQLYDERLSTRSRRLTGITTEVKSMAQKAGMVPRTFSYPEQEIEDFGLIRRSFVFNVQGTYAELRKFINLIEASRSFLSINELRVSGNEQGPELDISIQLSTLFTEGGESGEPITGTTTGTTTGTAPKPGGAQ